MAVQQLTQPIINPIAAFDSTKGAVVTFVVIGGAQVIGNRLIISDNQSGKQIYNQTQSTMKLEHAIPAGILSNGRYYNAVVRTIDNSGAESVASTAVPFYCYSQPSLTIDNIPTSETIENGTYKFVGSYLQSEGEALNSYQFTLYDSNKEVLSQTPLIYYETDSSLAYTFVGMSNDTSYYVSLTGETVNGTQITSGLKYFTVRYLQPASFAICDLVNDCDNGFIQISSNIVAIDGKSNPEPPIYIDNKEVDLRDPDSWVRWDEGFSIKNDFTMRVWGRDFTPYENIITLSNNLNSNNNPNKIEMKWMIGDTIKKLPSYSDADGYNVHLSNSKESPISNLSIKGETRQKVDNGRVINKGEGYVTLEPADGKNLLNVPANFTVTNTDIHNDIAISLKANITYTIKAKTISSDNKDVKNCLFRFRYNNADVSNPYARIPISGLKTTYTPPADIDEVWIYSGTGHNESALSNTTFEDLMIYEGTEEIPYEPFGYIPSNDFPCNISIIPGGNSIQETREESKSTVTGTEVTVNDTYINNQTKFNIDGNSYQETTEGYNILNVPEVLEISIFKEIKINLKANNTYTFKFDNAIAGSDNNISLITFRNTTDVVVKNLNTSTVKKFEIQPTQDITNIRIYASRDYSSSVGKTKTFQKLMIYEGTEDKPYEPYTGGIPSPSPDYPQEITNVGGYDNLFDKNNIISGSYVSDSNGAFVSNSTSKRTDYIEIQANSYYYIYSDKTSGNWGAWYDKDKKFISGITLGGQKEGTVNSPANARYIAFTISYQGNLTDYSKIKINETAIKIKQSGKNLFDKSTANIGKTLNAQGELQTDNGVGFSTSDYIQIEPNTNYYLYNVLPTYYVRTCGIYDDNKGFIKTVSLTGSNVGNLLILTPANAKYIRITYKTSDVDVVQVTKGTNLLPYEPYHEPIITPINLQGNILSKVGDVKDILKINRNGEVEIKKNIGKLVLNGTEDWGKDIDKNRETDYFYIFKSGIDSSNIANVISNRFVKGNDHTEGFWATSVFCITINKTRTGIISSDNSATRIQKFKTWLSQHPTEVYYELATPQIITLPSIPSIELWQGTNIFSLVTNLETEIELEYNYIPQSPSPEAPSEIRNVGNNINILDKNNISVTSGVETEILETGIRLIDTAQTKYEYICIPLGGKELLSKNITCYYDVLKNKNIYSNVELFFGTASSLTSGGIIQKQAATSSITWKVPSDFPNGSDKISIYLYISGENPPSSGYSVDFTNLKVEIGDTPTDYSPYGLGNISTVISNKNVFNLKRLIEMSSKYSKIENGYKFSATGAMYSKGVSCLYPISLPISMSYKIQNLTGTGFRFKFWFDNGKTESLSAYSSGTSSEETNIVINNYTKSRCETNCKNRY